MRTKLVLAAVAIVAIGSFGCTSRPLRSVFSRGAPCGASATTPLVGDPMTTYSPGCGGCGVADCPTCNTTSGLPIPFADGAMNGYFTDPGVFPGPGTPE